jgi:hypothetical protein
MKGRKQGTDSRRTRKNNTNLKIQEGGIHRLIEKWGRTYRTKRIGFNRNE